MSDEHVLAGRTRLAELGGRVVGFATTVLGDAAAELEDLFVDPDQRRAGIGRALVEDVAEAARQAGCSRVEVDANRHAAGVLPRGRVRRDGTGGDGAWHRDPDASGSPRGRVNSM